MRKSIFVAVCISFLFVTAVHAQKQERSRKSSPMQQESHPQAVGEAGVAWYTTWENGLAEAKRANRPIFFMSAATTCSGIPGVF